MKKIIVWALILMLLLSIASLAEETKRNTFAAAIGDVCAWIGNTARGAVAAWKNLADKTAPTIEAVGAWFGNAAETVSETAVGVFNSIVHIAAPQPSTH